MGRKQCGKKRNCSLRAISPFPVVFSKDLYCRHVKNQGLFGKGLRRKHSEDLSFGTHNPKSYSLNGRKLLKRLWGK